MHQLPTGMSNVKNKLRRCNEQHENPCGRGNKCEEADKRRLNENLQLGWGLLYCNEIHTCQYDPPIGPLFKMYKV